MALLTTPPLAVDAISIRPLLPSDSVTELTALLHRAYASLAAMDLRFMATHQGEDVTKARVESGQCFVAVTDQAIWGTILFRDSASTKGCPWYDRPDVACFGQFAVEPTLQSKGLGRRLVAIAETQAVALGAAEIALDTAEPAHHLIDWYHRLGYRHIEYTQWRHTNYRSVILSKTL